MADLNGITIEKGKIGANTITQDDAISGLIVASVPSSNLELDTPVVVYNLKDVKDLGIDSGFDTVNSVHVYRHISEFYRLAKEGTALYLMLVDRTTPMKDVLKNSAKTLLPFAKGTIKQLAIAVNPTTIPIMLNGLPLEVIDAIAAAQGFSEWAFDNNMPLQVILEGHTYSGNAASTQDLRAITNLNADKVSVFIGQDYNYAENLNTTLQKFADVGSALGLISRALVNQNIGNHNDDAFNLTNVVTNSWLRPGLSSHDSNDNLFQDLQTLEDKGFLFGLEYTGLQGVRVNNDHTCTPIVKDVDNSTNEHTIALGRVNDKAIRSLRTAYLPYVKTDWAVDSNTGKLPPAVVRALEDIGNQVFEDMIRRGEISFGETTVDKDSDLLIAKSLKVGYKIVPRGVISEINGIINLKTQV